MSIRFGVCSSFEKIPDLIEAGYDYLEFGFNALVNMSEDDFKKACDTVKANNFYAESFNTFFPGDMKLVGHEVDIERIKAHCEKGLKRAAALGGKVVVIGSGAARKVCACGNKEKAYEQFAEALGIVGDIAKEYGITVVVEPLNEGETNLINTVSEGLEICKKVNRENVKCLADFFHVYKSGESLDAVRNEGKNLGHLHLARANDDRAMPYEEDIPTVEEWAKAVKDSGYEGRLSLEGVYDPEFKECIVRTRKILKVFE